MRGSRGEPNYSVSYTTSWDTTNIAVEYTFLTTIPAVILMILLIAGSLAASFLAIFTRLDWIPPFNRVLRWLRWN